MAPIFAKDYNTIKSSPTKDRDDISFEDTKTNGYSIVRSAMLAVIIAIVAVVGVVTFHQSPSLSNGYDSLMSSMAVTPTSEKPVSTASPSPSEPDPDLRVCEISGQYPISGCVCPPGPSCGYNPAPTCICNFCCADPVHEDDGGDSNIDNDEFDKLLATLNENDTQMTVVDTSLGSKDDSDTILNRCGNLNMLFQDNIPSPPRVSTSGCARLQNGLVTGQFSVFADGTLRRPPISIRNTRMEMERRATYNLRTGTLFVSVGASPSQGGRVRIRMDWAGRNGRNAVEVRAISGLPSF